MALCPAPPSRPSHLPWSLCNNAVLSHPSSACWMPLWRRFGIFPPFPSSVGSIQLFSEVAVAAGGVGVHLPALGDALALSWSSKFLSKYESVAV